MEIPIQKALETGDAARQSGKFRAAYDCYQSILKADARNADVLYRLGSLAIELGCVSEALHFFRSALDGANTPAACWRGYVETLIQSNRIDDARKAIASAVKSGVSPDQFGKIIVGLNHMDGNPNSKTSGVVRKNILDTQSLDQAIKFSQRQIKHGSIFDAKRALTDILIKFPKNKRALELKKALSDVTSDTAPRGIDPPQPYLDPLIRTFHQGNLISVIDQATDLLKSFPSSAVLYNITGVANAGLGRFDTAIENYTQALHCFPNFPEAYNKLGICHHERGDGVAALRCFQRALALKSDYAEAYFNMGNAYRKIGDNSAAITSFRNAIAINPNYAEAHNNLGNALTDIEDVPAAIQSFKAAVEINSGYAEAYFNMANAYKLIGETDAAIRCYDRSITINPDYIEAYQNLVMIEAFDVSDPRYLKMVELHDRTNLNSGLRSRLCFALAMITEKQDQLAKSFKFLQEGNRLRKDGLPYDITRDLISADVIMAVNRDLQRCALHDDLSPPQPIPIFVLGMPRSGTTIVEQIISSHSAVYGAGELGFVPKFGAAIAQGGADIHAESLKIFHDRYLENISKLSGGRPFVTDKLPQNFKHIGLILAALPNARIVHVMRDPVATCWSNYKQYFTTDGLGFAYDLQDIIEYYKLYSRLMQFWHDQFPGRIYDLTYETLTSDQELETLNLANYLGLTWEEALLSPQRNTRNVLTASQQQVRKKLYQGSSQDWLRFKPYLGDVFDQLSHK